MGRGAYEGGNGVAAPAAAMPGWLGAWWRASSWGAGPMRAGRRTRRTSSASTVAPVSAPLRSRPPSHPLLQVRRYVYNDVVRLDDIEKLIDCSYVQPYTINSAKVVFLKPRPQSRPFKGSGNICLTCDRILQEPFHFCSLSCKVDHVLLRGDDLSSILFRFSESDFAFPHFENLRMDGSDLLEDDDDLIAPEDVTQHRGGSASSNGGAPKKKKSGAGFFPQIVLSLSNRRKGAPHRSPLS
ncbi:unnamed protein product [Musa acuminata var. zebrina]